MKSILTSDCNSVTYCLSGPYVTQPPVAATQVNSLKGPSYYDVFLLLVENLVSLEGIDFQLEKGGVPSDAKVMKFFENASANEFPEGVIGLTGRVFADDFSSAESLAISILYNSTKISELSVNSNFIRISAQPPILLFEFKGQFARGFVDITHRGLFETMISSMGAETFVVSESNLSPISTESPGYTRLEISASSNFSGSSSFSEPRQIGVVRLRDRSSGVASEISIPMYRK